MKNKMLGISLKIGTALSLLFVTACAEMYKRNLDLMEGTGSLFSQNLAEEYENLGETEHKVMYDEASASHYFQKAMKAKMGCPVLPNVLCEWRIPEEKLPEFTQARARLMYALERGGAEVAPQTAAHAQAYFDCWVEQESEGWQEHDIAACRTEFYKSIADVELMLKGGISRVPADAVVYFDYGHEGLDPEAVKVVDEVAHITKMKAPNDHVLLVGRTDKMGDKSHNLRLSRQRALAVKKELVRRGITPHHISIEAAGETAGEELDPKNRRVDILILDARGNH